ncbi:SiaB family protein kinase [Pseudoroseicyclus tamaricis]|uniref:Uncharacterized protein n=1 Tax=Pseudoroseicyclus tamaricis TaxID=2705421 RepID=A0A6B2JTE8_9RHOB|nr:SiaB family protein kinase [Pseudoroseicyclus tamaricis]NDV01235.1 hypothetical protein [Pseudoroseicyclus tamaricis]
MLAQRTYDLRADLQSRGVIFAYSGYVTDDILSGVGGALRREMASQDAARRTIRSVFTVFVEQMQNVIRYSDERLDTGGETLSYGILAISRESDAYVVHSGNVVSAPEVAPLREKLESLRGMDAASLKAAYKMRLRDGETTAGGGAGIGLIEIARRSTTPVGFDFLKMEDGRTFFAIEARIGGDA